MTSNKSLFHWAVALFITTSLLSCGKGKTTKKNQAGDSPATQTVQTQNGDPQNERRTPLRVMSYNLENMFDAKHDIETNRAGKEFRKNDAEFLPTPQCIDFFEFLKSKCPKKGKRSKSCRDGHNRSIASCKKGKNNWTQEKYLYKLGQVKKVFDLRQEKTGESSYPDLVAFSEIENSGVTQELAKLLGYGKNDHVTTKGFDNRGIDLAVIYRPNENFKKVSHQSHPIKRVELEGGRNGGRGRPTRPILEVVFEYYGKPLHVFVNHWPSLGGPTKLRNFAAEMLRKIIEQRYTENPDVMILALGDFNTADLEKQASEPHPFRDILLRGFDKNTAPAIFDVHHEALKKGHKLPPGSYYYGDKWQNLDRFFVSKNLIDRNGIDADLSQFSIFNAEELSEPCNRQYCHAEPRPLVPYRYKHRLSLEEINEQGQGFSDHYPTYMAIQ